MRKLLLLLLLAGVAPRLLAQRYWQQQVDRRIDVTLNVADKTLDGFLSLHYSNHSPDTLSFLWVHCWPNAFKNDRTVFSEQLLGNGRTDFYFSDPPQRGFMNRLDFRIDGHEVKIEDHPLYIDVIKVILPSPLPPGGQTTITTPFHVRLPVDFSGMGYKGDIFQLAHWYPEPAVYDRTGWHPLPYLDQGGFYTEFGTFDVRITVPTGFTVAATAALLDSSDNAPAKTLHYFRQNSNDFSWFASRHFRTLRDTLQLPSGRIIGIIACFTPKADTGWKRHSIQRIKAAIRFRSSLIGEYPYDALTVAESGKGLDYDIDHQVDLTWFENCLGPDSRRYPWLSLGISAYYDHRHMPRFYGDRFLASTIARKEDQPIATPAEDFSAFNYRHVLQNKTAGWLKLLEDTLGRPRFDSCMREYFRRWQFRHPYPEDFKAVLTSTGGRDLDSLFALLNRTGPIPMPPGPFFEPAPFVPIAAFNNYDHWMVGALITNYYAPTPSVFKFLLAPLYGTVSHRFNGYGNLSWSAYPNHGLHQIQLSLGAARFSTLSGTDSTGHQLYGGYYKFTPGIRIVFPRADARSTRETALAFTTYLISEDLLDHYVLRSADSLYYPAPGKYSFRYLDQLSLETRDDRALYPYNATLRLQQAANFYRIDFTGNYFFNYPAGGGLGFRLFGAKFGYLGSRPASEDLTRFEPKLTAVRGDEDYTYDNFFIGRNDFDGFASQQIMDRDGGLPLRTDLFQGLQGRSDNWVASINLTTTLPPQIIPAWLPLRAFFDAGTYADAWSNNPPTSHFLYVAGLELSFWNILHVYAPLFYSSDFSDQLHTVPDQNTFGKKISFSIELRSCNFRKLFGASPF
jgi:hypothetical protein